MIELVCRNNSANLIQQIRQFISLRKGKIITFIVQCNLHQSVWKRVFQFHPFVVDFEKYYMHTLYHIQRLYRKIDASKFYLTALLWYFLSYTSDRNNSINILGVQLRKSHLYSRSNWITARWIKYFWIQPTRQILGE